MCKMSILISILDEQIVSHKNRVAQTGVRKDGMGIDN